MGPPTAPDHSTITSAPGIGLPVSLSTTRPSMARPLTTSVHPVTTAARTQSILRYVRFIPSHAIDAPYPVATAGEIDEKTLRAALRVADNDVLRAVDRVPIGLDRPETVDRRRQVGAECREQ